MIIPGSTNGQCSPFIYLHGDPTINESWVYNSRTAWPQFHTELVFIVFRIEFIFIFGLVCLFFVQSYPRMIEILEKTSRSARQRSPRCTFLCVAVSWPLV